MVGCQDAHAASGPVGPLLSSRQIQRLGLFPVAVVVVVVVAVVVVVLLPAL